MVADINNFIFQQDGAPPHWKTEVRNYLDQTLPQRWVGRATDTNKTFARWPPRSPDLTPCDFHLWGYLKDKVYTHPLPEVLKALKRCIKAAVKTIDKDMLFRVWQEIDYRLDICRVTKGTHIEHLYFF